MKSQWPVVINFGKCSFADRGWVFFLDGAAIARIVDCSIYGPEVIIYEQCNAPQNYPQIVSGTGTIRIYFYDALAK